MIVILACSNAYISNQWNSVRIQKTARYMNQEPHRDQPINYDGLKVAGTLLSSLLFYPVISRASDTTGISDIMVKFDAADKPIKEYFGKKGTLIINVASQCALTPQYEDLVTLYKKWEPLGFTILAFPCNQFGSQEPAPIDKIRRDMKSQFDVDFPIFDKVEVNGGGQSNLYKKLQSYEGLGISTDSKKRISWNFEKFLIDAQGMPVRRYKPGVQPLALDADVSELLTTGALKPRRRTTLNE